MRCAALVVAGLALLAPIASAQPQTLFADDFEGDNDDWLHFFFESLWHFAPDGECGAVTTMVAWNWGFAGSCDYDLPFSLGTFISPPFVLSGDPPFQLRFDYLLDFDDPPLGDILLFTVMDATSFEDEVIADIGALMNDGELHEAVLTIPETWAGGNLRVGFVCSPDNSGNQGRGFFFDDISITNGGGWADLGGGAPGPHGELRLAGTGTLAPATTNRLDLVQADASVPVTLVVGLTELGLPFAGGTLVPFPAALVTLFTDATGSLTGTFRWPATAPPGTEVFFQVWMEADGALAASNGLRGTSS